MVRTAAEVQASIVKRQRQATKEAREFRQGQLLLEQYEDLRDDVMSLVKDSGLTYAEIHGRCGPCPATLEKWAGKEVRQPRLGKLRATLRILGYDLGIVEKATDNVVHLRDARGAA